MNRRKKTNRDSWDSDKVERKKHIIILVVLLCIVFIVTKSAYVNVAEIEKQVQQNLEDVAKQNALVLYSKIQSRYELITSLSSQLENVTEDTIQEKLKEFEIFLDEYDLKRFAFSFPNGNSYSTDGGKENLSFRQFYQDGMKGNCAITGVLSDALLEEHSAVNVMTIPVYAKDGSIAGVFGVAYDTEQFNCSLQIDSFDGQGYSCIVNENGEIVSAFGNKELRLSQNLFEDVISTDARNTEIAETMRKHMELKEGSGGILYLSEKNYYYCVPVQLMEGSVTWYILTFVPSQLVSDRAMPIQKETFKTILLVILFVTLGATLISRFIRQNHKQMMKVAYEDTITLGPNLPKFNLDMEKKQEWHGYLVILSVVNFSNLIIASGKKAGDDMIREVWYMIRDILEWDELAAHAREESFAMYLHAKDEDELIDRLKKLADAIKVKTKASQVYGIEACYGIYFMDGEEIPSEAYSKAFMALDFALKKRDIFYRIYSEDSLVKSQNESKLEDDFSDALNNKEFKVWYQPKFSTQDRKIVGSEALVRWQKEDGSMISPGEFIPLFERNGMIMLLDEYMFRSVCEQQKRWLDESKEIYPVSINISRASLYRMNVQKRYAEIMREYDIDPKYIQLEVTETVIGGKSDICDLLNRFRQMGVKILMDDFGTGYSSLNTLSTQCFDTLKLDKALIDHIGNREGELLLYHVIHMGQDLGLHITAEGVEEENQVNFLQNLNCDDIQGFYFSRPLPVQEYEALLNK